ncbi:MAG: RIO1 family regulatory kinase/ATPase, partial [Candidatus Bathyarchaeota archaeon]
EKEFHKRLREIEKLGVKFIEPSGPMTITNFRVLGKGYVGIVVSAQVEDGASYALKIRRMDADRINTFHEVKMLKKANSIKVGPTFHSYTKNFILMELIEGTAIPKWVANLKGRRRKARLKKTLREALTQCQRLDLIGLDHGELSQAPKHIIVDRKDTPRIIDFETASTNRKTSNLTSLCQYLFIGSKLSLSVRKILGNIDREGLIENLRKYKRNPHEQNFRRIISFIPLDR